MQEKYQKYLQIPNDSGILSFTGVFFIIAI